MPLAARFKPDIVLGVPIKMLVMNLYCESGVAQLSGKLLTAQIAVKEKDNELKLLVRTVGPLRSGLSSDRNRELTPRCFLQT